MLKPPTVELRPSKIHNGGVGVFSLRRISQGEKVGYGVKDSDYKRLISWATISGFDDEIQQRIANLSIGTAEGFLPPPDDDFNNLPFVFYFNHSCEGNCGFSSYGDFIAIRDIEKGEELTSDYGLAESNPTFKMLCTCGSPSCRKLITGNDWKSRSFRDRNKEFMLPRLRSEFSGNNDNCNSFEDSGL